MLWLGLLPQVAELGLLADSGKAPKTEREAGWICGGEEPVVGSAGASHAQRFERAEKLMCSAFSGVDEGYIWSRFLENR